MTPRHGDMWSEYINDTRTLFLFCANSTLNRNGELVMGAGSAKQAKAMFPGIEAELGRLVNEAALDGIYGLVVSKRYNVGAFQTKKNWRNPSTESVIRAAVTELKWYVLYPYTFAPAMVHMPYPGIGHGGLDKAVVEPLIIGLPDMVHVWTYK